MKLPIPRMIMYILFKGSLPHTACFYINFYSSSEEEHICCLSETKITSQSILLSRESELTRSLKPV